MVEGGRVLSLELGWLPSCAVWDSSMQRMRTLEGETGWELLIELARYRLDFLQTAHLDRLMQRLVKNGGCPPSLTPIRLALLGSSTLKHLVPGIRIAGLRRGLCVEVFEGDYGLYWQELLDPSSRLYQFAPEFICFAFDASHLLEISGGEVSVALERMRTCWKVSSGAFGCSVIQQTALPVYPDLLGNNEHRLLDSPGQFIERLNQELGSAADAASAHLLAVHRYASRDGLSQWHDPSLWLRARQDVHPRASVLYGDLLVRLIAAQRGRSAKCLVLDLDNTLWGGVVGDDGLNGILLGQGDPVGEAFLTFQRYVLDLKKRGIILAVCSKNDDKTARAPFRSRSEMLLKEEDIACFVANWNDKASNLREIASTLNIGTDALVFVDDNPFERNFVRKVIPEVIVPELPVDPALYVDCVAGAGYFEGLSLTADDRQRAEQYKANIEREALRTTTSDLSGYLRSLDMELLWGRFDESGMSRVVQLLNKTNQFNLTTKRYSEADARDLLADDRVLTWQIRLRDRFGDNGVVSLLIARGNATGGLEVDTWLMSCRVLGRQVEEAALNLLVSDARRLGYRRVIGEYRPTAKNAMVKDMYRRFGFALLGMDESGSTRWALPVDTFEPRTTYIRVLEASNAGT